MDSTRHNLRSTRPLTTLAWCCLGLLLVQMRIALAGNQWWDPSSAAGMQHGNGMWSTDPADTNWSGAVGGTVPGPWTNGNIAIFAAAGGVSTVTVSGVVTADVLTVSGSRYQILITNAATLVTTNATPTIGSALGADGNAVRLLGGPLGPAAWNAGGKYLYIGAASTTTNNAMVLDGAGSAEGAVLTNLGGLFLQGIGSSLVLTNGALVLGTAASADFRIGNNNAYDFGNRLIIHSNGVFDLSGSAPRFLMGEGGRGVDNVLIVDGGLFTNGGPTTLIAGTNSGIIVTNGGRYYSRGGLSLSATSNYVHLHNGLASVVGVASVYGQSRIVLENNSRLITTAESKIGIGANETLNTIRVLDRSVWNVGNGISVGESGASSNTLLVDNAVITNVQRLLIASAGAGKGNTVTLRNGGRLYHSGGNRDIGNSAGAVSNALSVVGGSAVTSLWDLGSVALSLGAAGSTGNAVRVDGADAPGSAALANLGALTVSGSTNGLAILRGGTVASVGAATIGNAAAARDCYLALADPESRWNLNGQALTVGAPNTTNNTLHLAGGATATNAGATGVGGVSNSIRILTGGRFHAAGLVSVGNAATAQYPAFLLHGGSLALGGGLSLGGENAQVTIVNPVLISAAGPLSVGATGSNNTFQVALGTISLWDARTNAVTVGAAGTNNVLLVNGATLTNVSSLTVGTLNLGSANTLILTNGARLFGVPASGSLTVRDNSLAVVDGSTLNLGAAAINILIAGQGAPARWEVRNNAVVSALVGNGYIGSVGSGNQLLLTGGTTFNTLGGLWIGAITGTAGSNNSVLVDNSVLASASSISLGSGAAAFQATSNSLVITNSGKVFGASLSVGGTRSQGNILAVIGGTGVTSRLEFPLAGGLMYLSNGATNVANMIVVDGRGEAGSAIITNASTLRVAAGIANTGNRLIITNKGEVHVTAVGAYISATTAAGEMGSTGNVLLVTGAGSVFNNSGLLLNIGQPGATNNGMLVTDGGLVTNMGPITLLGSSNGVAVTAGGSLYSAASSLSLGGAGTDNWVAIDQGGIVDNLNTLLVSTNNRVRLLGGTLGTSNAVGSNGLVFTVGDGAQSAKLKALGPGGTLVFHSGLVIASNAALEGMGTVSGGSPGTTLTNGALLSPGLGGAGALVIGGNNLTLQGGSAFRCTITNLGAGPGLGWDLVSVTTQVVFQGGPLTIRLDSLGTPAANFLTNLDYNLRILTYGSQTGYDPAAITLDTSAFLPATTWGVTNTSNSLYLVYRGDTPPASPSLTWAIPSNGNWSVGANWVGGTAPAASGSPTNVLVFGDNGTPYASTNDLAGAFTLNQLQLSSSFIATNQVKGGRLVFTNNGAMAARLDLLAGGGGAFIISNPLTLASDTTAGGSALAGTVTLAGVVTNLGTFTKRGSWTLALGAANALAGPVVVDSPDGGLRLANLNALNGAGDVIVSNGLLTGWTALWTFAPAGQHNRRIRIQGAGSVWTNANQLNLTANGATNVQVVVNEGRLYAGGLGGFVNGSTGGRFVITNGAEVRDTGNANPLASASSECMLWISGTNSSLYRNQALAVAAAGGMTNTLIVERGGLIWGGNNFFLSAGRGAAGNRYEVRLGGLARPYQLNVHGSNNTALIRDEGTIVFLPGGASYVSSVGASNDTDNSLTVADGAIVTNIYFQVARESAAANRLTVTNGGRIYAASAAQYLAYGGPVTGNTITVTGPNSLWDLKAQNLFLCRDTGTINRLTLQDGGAVTGVLNLVVAMGVAASNNGVTVDGGALYATRITTSNDLPNDVTLTGSGVIHAAYFIVTNPQFAVNFLGGTLNVRASLLVSNGVPLVVGDGVQSAHLPIIAGATNIFSHGLILATNAWLTGNGLIQTPTSTLYGILSPGIRGGIGSLTNAGTLALSGTATSLFEIASDTLPGAGWDHLVVSGGGLTLGGRLLPVLSAGYQPSNAASFTIMTNLAGSGISGVFVNGGNGARINAYSNDLTTVLGSFSLAVDGTTVRLGAFAPPPPIRPGTFFRFQ